MVKLLVVLISIAAGTLVAFGAGGPGALLFDMAKQAVATTPTTGAITLSGAMPGFQTLTASGAISGQLLSYSISDTPTGWEVGRGTFMTSTGGFATLTRSPLFSSNNNTAISASINAVVAASILQEDMLIGEATGTLAQRFGTTPQTLFVYNTADPGIGAPTNYERGIIGWSSNILTVGEQNAGSGVNRELDLVSGSLVNVTDGTFQVRDGSGIGFYIASHASVRLNGTGILGWSNTGNDASQALDTGLSRDSAGVVDVGNGSAADASGTVKAAAYSAGGASNVAISPSSTRAQTISTTSTLFAAAINAPAIAQLGANTTGYVCWTTGTGAISEDSATCLSSLRELKKEISPFSDATAELMALRPSIFQWKDPVGRNQQGQQLGFIAEDVQGVDARLASYDSVGNLHGWRQDSMIATLVRGFQEQQKEIARLKAQLADRK